MPTPMRISPESVKRLFQFSLLLLGLLILTGTSGAEQPIPKGKGLVNDFAKVISPAI